MFFPVLPLLFSAAVNAQTEEEIAAAAAAAEAEATEAAENESSTGGVGDWGLGFGLGVEQYRKGFIENASINGEERIVVTEQTYNTRPSAWLTINWNIGSFGSDKIKGITAGNTKSMKWGAFAGVKLVGNSTDTFSSFALGPQVTFETDKGRAISVGFGWVTHGTKTYANGITPGESLPVQFDDIVYEEGTENSYMIMMSVGVI